MSKYTWKFASFLNLGTRFVYYRKILYKMEKNKLAI